MSLRQITIGSAAMSSVTLLRMLAQFFILPLLARYISPSEYGLIAIAMPFVLFAMLFSDAGVSSSLIRSKEKNITEWSTSFWFIVGLGTILTLIITVVGFLVSIVMTEPVLFPLIAYLSSIILLQSIATVPGAALQHSNRFPLISGIEIISMAFSLLATCIAAINGWGAWSLVAQQFVHYAVKLFLTWSLSRFRPYFVFDFSTIKEHVIFGRDLLGSHFIIFIRETVRNIILGRILGTHLVGIYAMSSLFSDLPRRVVTGPLQAVLYPRMSAQRDNLDVLRSFFLFSSQTISIIVTPVIGMIAVAHEPIFTLFLSEKWAQVGVIFMLSAPSSVMTCVTSLRNTVLMAIGRTDILVRQSIEVTVLILGTLCVSVFYGLEAIAIAMTVLSLTYTPYALSKLFPLIELSPKVYIKAIYIPLVTTLLSITSYLYFVDTLFTSDLSKVLFAMALGAFALIFGAGLQIKTIRREIDCLKVSFF